MGNSLKLVNTKTSLQHISKPFGPAHPAFWQNGPELVRIEVPEQKLKGFAFLQSKAPFLIFNGDNMLNVLQDYGTTSYGTDSGGFFPTNGYYEQFWKDSFSRLRTMGGNTARTWVFFDGRGAPNLSGNYPYDLTEGLVSL